MKSAIIHDLPDWQVTSWGNGLAYEILHKPSKRTLFFQGDDAEIYREQFQQLTEGVPCLDFADALAVIWADYSEIVL
jgi:hypothetical protein